MRRFLILGALAFFPACGGCVAPPAECIEGDEEVCDAGLPPDFCNSQEEAVADVAHCHLTVGSVSQTAVRKTDVFISTLADGTADKDWYVAQLPDGLNEKSLLHINAGYSAAQTAVDFSLNVLQDTGGTLKSIVSAVDRHGTAAPKPVDVVVPFSTSNARLFVLASHEAQSSQVKVDNRNPYSVLIEVFNDPDENEPNNTTPTPISLAASSDGERGSQSGYLATAGDVDLYSFSIGSAARQIIYLRLKGPNPQPSNPAPPFRLSYTLLDPTGVPIAEDSMETVFLPIDLATARLARGTGTYTLKVKAFQSGDVTAPVKGDLRVKYEVEVRVLPELDVHEPNDSLPQAKPVSLTLGAPSTLVGKLSAVPDEEWFRFTFPAQAQPSVLRYSVSVAADGGRFEPLSIMANRKIRVVREVTQGATAEDRLNACIKSASACPKGYSDPQSSSALLVEAVCKSAAAPRPPLCLYAQRNEEPQFTNLKNLAGAIPIAANETTELYLSFLDEGRGQKKYADDRDWRLELSWEADADEASRAGGPTVVTLGSGSAEATGQLTFGYGRLVEPFDVNSGQGVRGPQDYDAFETDRDQFRFALPTAATDQSWKLEWAVQHAGGGPPGDIALELTFCGTGAAPDGGLCADARTNTIAFTGDRLSPWYLPFSRDNAAVLFSKATVGDSTVVSFQPAHCPCFSVDRLASGQFFATVVGVNRVSNAPIAYSLRQSLGDYPTSFTGADGGVQWCPVVDAGCGFPR